MDRDIADKAKVWTDVLAIARLTMSAPVFTTWLSQTHLVELRDNADRIFVEIGCASSYVKATVETKYSDLIRSSLTKILDKDVDILFSIKAKPTATQDDSPTPLFGEPQKEDTLLAALTRARIRPTFSFANFAVSGSNQMAFAAAEAVAQSPGSAYNPLFIWGGVGVGKSHLMSAVGHHMLSTDPDARVHLCTGEDFTNDIVEGIRNKTTQNFRDKYRKLRMLLVDDIQFIAGKDAVQDEFFHTFNAVTSAGGQVIMTSDRPPGEIAKLEDRLKSRFEAGLIVDIAPPDFELRCAIVQIKAQEKGITLETSQIQAIAGNIDAARKIEGFLMKLISGSRLRNTPITEELVGSLLTKKADGENEVKKKVTPDALMTAVCSHFSVGKRAIVGETRTRSIARPRQILMYLLRTEAGIPLQEIGRLLGGRDHSTVIHAVRTITALSSTNVQIREDILGIKNTLS